MPCEVSNLIFILKLVHVNMLGDMIMEGIRSGPTFVVLDWDMMFNDMFRICLFG